MHGNLALTWLLLEHKADIKATIKGAGHASYLGGSKGI